LFFNLFGKKPDLREQLFAAVARGDAGTFAELCRKNHQAILQAFPDWRRAPDSVRQDREQIQRYGNGLVAIARFFAERLNDTSLLELLQGTDEENPLRQWQVRLQRAQLKMDHGDFTAAREDLLQLYEDTKGLSGPGADQLMPYTLGSLAACHFHLAQLDQAEQATLKAVELCRQRDDREGMARYYCELYELERYRDRRDKAREYALLVASLTGSETWRRAADQVQSEPLLRILATVNDQEVELSDLKYQSDARVQFGFRRNKASLGESRRLNERGKSLAGQARFEEALESFLQAQKADPHEPDCRFMAGLTLVYLKRYREALDHYAEVERLAPGWFHSRNDAWLATELAEGRLSHQVWETLMDLEHMPPDQALREADKALAEAPLLPPLLYRKGVTLEALGRPEDAVRALRAALEHNREPNLQTRVLLRLSQLVEGNEQTDLLRRAEALKGDLIASAMAGFLLSRTA
jgi:tetratricopeptide (TPR) repeat protein